MCIKINSKLIRSSADKNRILPENIPTKSGKEGFRVHDCFSGFFRWIFGTAVKIASGSKVYFVNKASLRHWWKANISPECDFKTFLKNFDQILSQIKREGRKLTFEKLTRECEQVVEGLIEVQSNIKKLNDTPALDAGPLLKTIKQETERLQTSAKRYKTEIKRFSSQAFTEADLKEIETLETHYKEMRSTLEVVEGQSKKTVEEHALSAHQKLKDQWAKWDQILKQFEARLSSKEIDPKGRKEEEERYLVHLNDIFKQHKLLYNTLSSSGQLKISEQKIQFLNFLLKVLSKFTCADVKSLKEEIEKFKIEYEKRFVCHLEQNLSTSLNILPILQDGAKYCGDIQKLRDFPQESSQILNTLKAMEIPTETEIISTLEEMSEAYAQRCENVLNQALAATQQEILTLLHDKGDSIAFIDELFSKFKLMSEAQEVLETQFSLAPSTLVPTRFSYKRNLLENKVFQKLKTLSQETVQSIEKKLKDFDLKYLASLNQKLVLLDRIESLLSLMKSEFAKEHREEIKNHKMIISQQVIHHLKPLFESDCTELSQHVRQAESVLINSGSSLKDFIRNREILNIYQVQLSNFKTTFNALRICPEVEAFIQEIDKRKKECEDILERLLDRQIEFATLYYEKESMPMSGHCLFHAFAYHLKGDKSKHMEIKKLAADTIRKNQEQFRQQILDCFIPNPEGDAETFLYKYKSFYDESKTESKKELGDFLESLTEDEKIEEYCKCLESDTNVWGGHIEIQALSLVINRPFCNARFGSGKHENKIVILHAYNPHLLETQEPFLLCYDGAIHYDAFIKKVGTPKSSSCSSSSIL